ncbi:MAG TPA: type II toxin-antitoxin system prevent-host-death family antitoxin [Terracidiphilus sp.]|jgi:prevent-host-death family protein
MRTINIHQAKTHLSRLVDEAVQGDSFIITKAGKPKVLVTRLDAPVLTWKRRLGLLEGTCTLPDNYWEIDKERDQEIEKTFFGKDEE